jgi:hypothetical protein
VYNHLVDDQLPAKILMPPESILHLQLVVMDKHLLDNELTAQLTMSPESDLLLQNAGMAHSRCMTPCPRNL